MLGWVRANGLVPRHTEDRNDEFFDENIPNYKTRDEQFGDRKHTRGHMASTDESHYSVENSLYVRKRNGVWFLDAVKVLCTAALRRVNTTVWEPYSYGNTRREGDDVNTLCVMYPSSSDPTVIDRTLDTQQHHRGAVEEAYRNGLDIELKVFLHNSGGTNVRASRVRVVNPWLFLDDGVGGRSPGYMLRLARQ